MLSTSFQLFHMFSTRCFNGIYFRTRFQHDFSISSTSWSYSPVFSLRIILFMRSFDIRAFNTFHALLQHVFNYNEVANVLPNISFVISRAQQLILSGLNPIQRSTLTIMIHAAMLLLTGEGARPLSVLIFVILSFSSYLHIRRLQLALPFVTKFKIDCWRWFFGGPLDYIIRLIEIITQLGQINTRCFSKTSMTSFVIFSNISELQLQCYQTKKQLEMCSVRVGRRVIDIQR